MLVRLYTAIHGFTCLMQANKLFHGYILLTATKISWFWHRAHFGSLFFSAAELSAGKPVDEVGVGGGLRILAVSLASMSFWHRFFNGCFTASFLSIGFKGNLERSTMLDETI